MALLRRLYGRLRLHGQPDQEHGGQRVQRKFLGYSFWVAPGGRINRRVAEKARATFKQRVRELTGRSGGLSMQ